MIMTPATFKRQLLFSAAIAFIALHARLQMPSRKVFD